MKLLHDKYYKTYELQLIDIIGFFKTDDLCRDYNKLALSNANQQQCSHCNHLIEYPELPLLAREYMEAKPRLFLLNCWLVYHLDWLDRKLMFHTLISKGTARIFRRLASQNQNFLRQLLTIKLPVLLESTLPAVEVFKCRRPTGQRLTAQQRLGNQLAELFTNYPGLPSWHKLCQLIDLKSEKKATWYTNGNHLLPAAALCKLADYLRLPLAAFFGKHFTKFNYPDWLAKLSDTASHRKIQLHQGLRNQTAIRKSADLFLEHHPDYQPYVDVTTDTKIIFKNGITALVAAFRTTRYDIWSTIYNPKNCQNVDYLICFLEQRSSFRIVKFKLSLVKCVPSKLKLDPAPYKITRSQILKTTAVTAQFKKAVGLVEIKG